MFLLWFTTFQRLVLSGHLSLVCGILAYALVCAIFQLCKIQRGAYLYIISFAFHFITNNVLAGERCETF